MASKGYSPETRRLLDALSRRTVAYHPDLASALGSIPAAIILGQLLYWHGKQADPDGWIMKTAKELEDETAVTERQQENARAILTSAGAVQFERRGLPAMPYFKLDHDKIIELYIATEPAKIPLLGESKFPPDSILKFPPFGDSNTEITTENTQENSVRRAAADAAAKAAGIDKMPSVRVAKAKAKKAEANSQYDLGELENASFIKIHRQVCGVQLITAEQAKRIISQANWTPDTTWRERLRYWMAKGWRADMIDKHILYNETENKRLEARTPVSQESERLKAQRAALEAELAGME